MLVTIDTGVITLCFLGEHNSKFQDLVITALQTPDSYSIISTGMSCHVNLKNCSLPSKD